MWEGRNLESREKIKIKYILGRKRNFPKAEIQDSDRIHRRCVGSRERGLMPPCLSWVPQRWQGISIETVMSAGLTEPLGISPNTLRRRPWWASRRKCVYLLPSVSSSVKCNGWSLKPFYFRVLWSQITMYPMKKCSVTYYFNHWFLFHLQKSILVKWESSLNSALSNISLSGELELQVKT